ncbi:hypothetical protein [Puia dinghuensis]|uniref:Secreted protein n=1 Tax=Puia dinghuensis TaxID=1792502 RepID=A0A8J2UGX4_9BACT|nr:hypothetical protein [Puia dinghuensis]GGB15886.1 hypothetical protein GCM10011511_44680 [Puia dinghuensis]
MRLRLLFTLGLVLALSTIATSNECRRFCGCPHASKASIGSATSRDKTAAPAPAANEEYSMLLTSKLLYI